MMEKVSIISQHLTGLPGIASICFNDVLKRTDWRPTAGMDPDLREYRCTYCDKSIYLRTKIVQLQASAISEPES